VRALSAATGNALGSLVPTVRPSTDCLSANFVKWIQKVPRCDRNHVYTYRPREGQVRRRDGLRSRLLLSRPPRPVRCSAWSTCACVCVSRFGSEVVCVIPRAPKLRFQKAFRNADPDSRGVRTSHLAHVESSLRNNLLPILDPRAQSPAATPRLHRRGKCRSRA
jgi:hypothetical protein